MPAKKYNLEELTPKIYETQHLSCREAAEIIGINKNTLQTYRRYLNIHRKKWKLPNHVSPHIYDIGTKHITNNKAGINCFIKVNNGINTTHENWVLEHKYVYEQAYGKIKKGQCVFHLDGNRLNNELSNLYLTRQIIISYLKKRNWIYKNDPIAQLCAIKLTELIFEVKKNKRRLTNE